MPAATYASKYVPIWIDGQFSANDKIEIEHGIDQWNQALNGYMVLHVESDNFDMEPSILERVAVRGDGWLFLKIDSRNSIVHDEGSNLTLAFVNRIGSNGNRVYYVSDRLNTHMMQGVTMHEVGHLLGANHHGLYLMQPTFHWAEYRCIDQGTLQQVATYWHLPLAHLHYCVYGE